MCGTTEYLPPEILMGATQNNKVDIWCLGVLLYELIHKRTPFDSRSNNSLLIDQNSNQIVFNQGLSEDIKTLIKKCLKVIPRERAEAQEIIDSPVFSHLKKENTPKEESIRVNNEIINRQAISNNPFKKKQTVKAKTNIYQNVVADKIGKDIIYSNVSFKKKKKNPSINKIKNETKKRVIKYSAPKESIDLQKNKRETSNSPSIVKVKRQIKLQDPKSNNLQVKEEATDINKYKNEIPTFYLNKNSYSHSVKYIEPNKLPKAPLNLNSFNIYQKPGVKQKPNVYNYCSGKVVNDTNMKKLMIGQSDFTSNLTNTKMTHPKRQYKYSYTQSTTTKMRPKKSSFHKSNKPITESKPNRRVINLDEVQLNRGNRFANVSNESKGLKKRSSSFSKNYIGGSLNLRLVKK